MQGEWEKAAELIVPDFYKKERSFFPRALTMGKGCRKDDSDPLSIQLYGNDVDVSSWVGKHPGGGKLLKIFADRDATQQFEAIHKGNSAAAMLKTLPQKPAKKLPNARAGYWNLGTIMFISLNQGNAVVIEHTALACETVPG